MQEVVWAFLKKEYYMRLHRRDENIKDEAEFSQMIEKLCEEVPINTDNILRSNRAYVNYYLALGEE